MKAEDFRIGNLVYYHLEDPMDERKEWDEVSPIDYDDLRILTEFKDHSEYTPIPLTEEWLLKLNAKSTELSPAKNGIWIECEIDNQGCWVSISNGTGVVVRRIDYVHQLQNLYFALTDEELTIKL